MSQELPGATVHSLFRRQFEIASLFPKAFCFPLEQNCSICLSDEYDCSDGKNTSLRKQKLALNEQVR
jgi:hypothetical protein